MLLLKVKLSAAPSTLDEGRVDFCDFHLDFRLDLCRRVNLRDRRRLLEVRVDSDVSWGFDPQIALGCVQLREW